MCRLHLSAPPPDDDNYFDCLRWDFDCYDFVYLSYNSRPFGYVAGSLCVVMSRNDQRMTAVDTADVGHRSYVA